MRQNGHRAQPARPADADELGLAPDGRRAGRRRDLARRHEGRLHASTATSARSAPPAARARRPGSSRPTASRARRSTARATSTRPPGSRNSRILNSGGYGSHVNIQDLGTEPYNWLTDQQTDLGDAELTRAGDKLVAVRGYDDSTHIVWYSVTGNALSGPKPPAPTAICATGEQAGFDQPTWAPDGNQVAWSEPDGIWIHRDAAGCETQQPKLVLPGGSEADWGPANVNPGPRPTTGGGRTTGGGGPAGGGGATGGGGGRRRPRAAGVHAQGAGRQAARQRPRAQGQDRLRVHATTPSSRSRAGCSRARRARRRRAADRRAQALRQAGAGGAQARALVEGAPAGRERQVGRAPPRRGAWSWLRGRRCAGRSHTGLVRRWDRPVRASGELRAIAGQSLTHARATLTLPTQPPLTFAGVATMA